MIKLILFLASLVVSLGLILYTESSWQLIIILGQQKVVLNFWFALIVLFLTSLLLYWLLGNIRKFFSFSSWLRQYFGNRRYKERQYARGQAVMYALSGEYATAIQQLPPSQDEVLLSDLILYATWVNQLEDLQKLDETLGHIQRLNAVPEGWMIWFRAYLLSERGKHHLACELLLDALDSGLVLKSLVTLFASFVDPVVHYDAIARHYKLMCRYLPESKVRKLWKEAAVAKLDKYVDAENWEAVDTLLADLPRKIRSDPQMQYYIVKSLLASGQNSKALDLLTQSSFQDQRLIPLLANLEIDAADKIKLVTAAIKQSPTNKDLFYLLSYLQAQDGDVSDTVKTLESILRLK